MPRLPGTSFLYRTASAPSVLRDAIHVSAADVFAGVQFRGAPHHVPRRPLPHRGLGAGDDVATVYPLSHTTTRVRMCVEAPFVVRAPVYRQYADPIVFKNDLIVVRRDSNGIKVLHGCPSNKGFVPGSRRRGEMSPRTCLLLSTEGCNRRTFRARIEDVVNPQATCHRSRDALAAAAAMSSWSSCPICGGTAESLRPHPSDCAKQVNHSCVKPVEVLFEQSDGSVTGVAQQAAYGLAFVVVVDTKMMEK